MRDIFEDLKQLVNSSQDFALATVVRTQGSTPQKPGAKMLVRTDGSFRGTLGGGCVEAEALTSAKEALAEALGPEVRSFSLNDELAERDGLVCGGTMHILIETPHKDLVFAQITKEIDFAFNGGPSVALAVLTKSGQQGGPVGSKLLVRENGTTIGTLGSPELDHEAVKPALQAMPYGRTDFVKASDGSEFYVEGFTSPATVVLMGGGHVSRAIYKLARFLDYQVIIIDDRPEFANKERFPEASQLVVGEYDKSIESLNLAPNSFIIVATRGHKYDDAALLAAAHTPARYVGLLGSKRKAMLIYPTLINAGVSLERIREIHSPVGINVGGRTPEEIAMSIMAEVQMVRLGGDGQSMKMDEKLLQKAYQKAQKLKTQKTLVPA